MEEYQKRYVQNVREIQELLDPARDLPSREEWLQRRLRAMERVRALRAENRELLSSHLFPALDGLHGAGGQELEDLVEFAGALMDWRTNLDIGVYVAIHEAFLSLARARRDRDGVIRECYMVGMGLYYLDRMVQGMRDELRMPFLFQNEMVFMEAASYFHHIEEIGDEPTKGYILRSLANIALATTDHKRKIAASHRMLTIIRDENIRALAPGLPWDAYLRGTHQQMSANRHELSRGDLSSSELAAVLDSCYEVFKPEEGREDPSVRWLWPYYEMEYSCGYVDLATTVRRLERLIFDTPADTYDMSGLYGNVQLPIYYGRLLERNARLLTSGRIHTLQRAYEKMLHTLMSCPAGLYDDYFYFNVHLVISGYVECEGVAPYREVITSIMQKLCGDLYVRSRRSGEMMALFCEAIEEEEEGFFDEVPRIRRIRGREEKKRELASFARNCGLFHDVGLIKMNVERTMQTRSLFEGEFAMFRLHTVSGSDDLRARRSTAEFADVALGHHGWYAGGGYPDQYVRSDSPCRQLTDVMAVVAAMQELYRGDMQEVVQKIISQEGSRFSPLVSSYLTQSDLVARLEALLKDGGERFYGEIYEALTGGRGR